MFPVNGNGISHETGELEEEQINSAELAITGVVALVTYEFCTRKLKSKSYNE